MTHAMGRRAVGGVMMVVTCGALLAAPAPVAAQYGTQGGEWRSYGGDIGSTKYSPLDQITRDNFAQLEEAWRWSSVDDFLSMTTPDGGEWWADYDTIVEQLVTDTPNLYRDRNTPNRSNLQATPLMVGGVLYINTPLSQGAAIDAATGRTLWVYNPKSYEEGTTSMTVTWRERGVAYWTDGADEERIFWGTGNGSLVCVEAKTGRPCQHFGQNGIIDAMTGLPRAVREDRDYLNAMLFSIQSPPLVVRDTVIHGSSVSDRRITKEAVPGWVRAWDVRTGEHKWDFHTVPANGDEFGADTWLNESWRYSGNANVWSMLSGDDELGYVYLPTGTGTNDYYGGHRLGDNLFAESLVAVDIETGERVWHFQASRPVGLRLSGRPEFARYRGRGSAGAGDRTGQQTGVCLHLRPRHRRSDLADRGAGCRDRPRDSRRSARANPALSYEASRL